MRWIGLALGLLLLGVFSLAAFDYVRFVDKVDKSVAVPGALPMADAVVVLTGSSDARIVEAIKLRQKLQAPLLISGVHIDTKPADIARVTNTPLADITCCVTLGYAAADTWGNGEEVADWARDRKVKRIIVVTSDYHMVRAMLELKRAMPEAEFLPWAVGSLKVPARDWWRDFGTARRLAEEWVKYRASKTLGGGPAAIPQPVVPTSPPVAVPTSASPSPSATKTAAP
jgi:uncharacterized SAM-binding protein YcdF (DUF218 family)